MNELCLIVSLITTDMEVPRMTNPQMLSMEPGLLRIGYDWEIGFPNVLRSSNNEQANKEFVLIIEEMRRRHRLSKDLPPAWEANMLPDCKTAKALIALNDQMAADVKDHAALHQDHREKCSALLEDLAERRAFYSDMLEAVESNDLWLKRTALARVYGAVGRKAIINGTYPGAVPVQSR